MTKKEILNLVSKTYMDLDELETRADELKKDIRRCMSYLEEIPDDINDIKDDVKE